jgi:hypothetical protein
MFYEFAANVEIDSKETGGAVAFEAYTAQKRFFDSIFDGLEKGIHWNVILKARQLGISTGSYIFDIFWLSVFPGIKGALVFDTDANKDGARLDIQRMLESLPSRLQIPVFKHNRNALILQNGSSLSYLVAGTRKNGGLGRSKGLSFIHASEVSSWGDQEGVESLTKALAQKFPARLFIFESTARGYNLFYKMWEQAKVDPVKQATFIGWWAKEAYAFDEHSLEERDLYLLYSQAPLTKEEQEKVAKVKLLYGFDVTMSQVAWYRHEKNPALDVSEEIDPEDEGSIFQQELPWDEDEAFIISGNSFFSAKRLTDVMKYALTQKYYGYRYFVGEEFSTMVVEPTNFAKMAMLKVWEEPVANGIYVIGADPAYGSSDKADFYCIQVLRCYADGADQVAEFTIKTMETYQFAWVLMHLAGSYKNARVILEINGPGQAVFNEMRNLRLRLQNGELLGRSGDSNFTGVFDNVKSYLYSRIDNVGGGSFSYHWKTNNENKNVIFNQLRDALTLQQIKIRSKDCVEQMKTIVQSGLSIEGDGNSHDDLPMSLALATHAWLIQERPNLQIQGHTREATAKAARFSDEDMPSMYMKSVLQGFFTQRAADKRKQEIAALRARRRR